MEKKTNKKRKVPPKWIGSWSGIPGVLQPQNLIDEQKRKDWEDKVKSIKNSLDPISLKRFILMKELDFDAGHRLVNYKGKCGHNHGHYYKVEIYLSGDHLNDLGILEDFSEIKDRVHAWIDRNWDHAMLLNSRDIENVKFHQKMKYKIFLFRDENPTAENISKFLYYKVKELTGFNVLQVTVYESPKSAATFTEQQSLKGLIEI